MYSSMSSYLFMPAVLWFRYSAVGSMKPATLAVSALCPPAHLKPVLSVGENLPGRMSLPTRSFHVGESREGSGRKNSALEESVHASGKYPALRDLQETGHFNRHLILQNSGRRKCAKIARSALRSGCRRPTGPCYGGDFSQIIQDNNLLIVISEKMRDLPSGTRYKVGIEITGVAYTRPIPIFRREPSKFPFPLPNRDYPCTTGGWII